MDTPYWIKQTADAPLFAELLWSRPENRLQSGKLLVIGGNGYEFKAPANAYGDALNAGVGTAKVLLPDSMKKTVQDVFPEAEFAPSTPSGSLARRSLAPALDLAEWADAVLLAGDLGRNSETAIMLESFAHKYTRQLTITKDAADYFVHNSLLVLDRAETCLVISFAQLQKLAIGAHFSKAFTFTMDLLRLVDTLREFSEQHGCAIVVKHLETIFIAYQGRVSSTKLIEDIKIWRVATAASASVWWLQNPSKPFEALTTSLIADSLHI